MGRKSTEQIGYSKSAGQSQLFEIVQKIFPQKTIKQDLNLRKFTKKKGYSWKKLSDEYGATLAPIIADIVVFSDPLIILEYNGAQHYKYTSHWHGDANGYKEAQERDNQKIWLCQRLAIPMVTIAFNEKMDVNTIRKKIEEALRNTPLLPGYTYCSNCHNIYLEELLQENICHSCNTSIQYELKQRILNEQMKQKINEQNKQIRSEQKETAKAKQRENYLAQKEELKNSDYYQMQKELQKEYRRAAEKKYKQSDEYLAQKEKIKQKQKEYRQQIKKSKQQD